MPAKIHWGGIPRAGDISKTKVLLGEGNALDPFCEFPVREILGVSFSTAAGSGADPSEPLTLPRGPEKKMAPAKDRSGRFAMETISAADYEP